MPDLELKPGPLEVLRNMGPAIYKEAYEKKRTLTAHLNEIIPVKDYRESLGVPEGRELDSFQMLLALSDIAVSTDMERGYWSDDFSAFLKDDSTRGLIPEWMTREWRKAKNPQTRAIYLSSDQVDGSLVRPYADSPTARWDTQVAPAIPLTEMVATTIPVDGDTYRSFYMTSNAAQSRMVRVAEGAEIPRVKLVGGEHLIRLHKFGRAIEITYEALRRMKIDLVAMHVQRMAVQSEIDKVSWAIDVIVNGDGNSGTSATVHTLTSLDSAAVAGTLTLKGWLRFRMKFANPYFPTTSLANEDVMLQQFLLNAGSGNQPLMSLPAGVVGSMTPINPGLANSLRVGWTADAPALKIVTFDRRNSLLHLTEVGADISEVEKFIARQTQLLTLSEVEGFQILDGNAARILNVNA